MTRAVRGFDHHNEQLFSLCALLLMAFYSVRSERQLIEQLDFDWFVGL